jgi:4'-phosphopantetheinyl transferase
MERKRNILTKIKLAENELHLWLVKPEMITDKTLLDSYYPLMNKQEAIQQKRFIFKQNQHQYLITRALVRTVLSRYCNLPPAELCFEKNRHGKPEISSLHKQKSLRFNLAHTDGQIICGVVLDHDLGVDVENESRKSETTAIAHRFFSVNEIENLDKQPQDKQRSRFFDFWTLKESYIKACGLGLAIPLNHFHFDLTQDNKIGISFISARDDQPDSWQFWLLQTDPTHKIAISLRCGIQDRKYKLMLREIVPLQSEKIVSSHLLRSSG